MKNFGRWLDEAYRIAGFALVVISIGLEIAGIDAMRVLVGGLLLLVGYLHIKEMRK